MSDYTDTDTDAHCMQKGEIIIMVVVVTGNHEQPLARLQHYALFHGYYHGQNEPTQ